jgi:hypothetical protein
MSNEQNCQYILTVTQSLILIFNRASKARKQYTPLAEEGGLISSTSSSSCVDVPDSALATALVSVTQTMHVLRFAANLITI